MIQPLIAIPITIMSIFQVRCHEWGDDSDYFWTNCNSLESALQCIKDFEEENPFNLYEVLYIVEITKDGTKKIPNWDRETYKPL